MILFLPPQESGQDTVLIAGDVIHAGALSRFPAPLGRGQTAENVRPRGLALKPQWLPQQLFPERQPSLRRHRHRPNPIA